MKERSPASKIRYESLSATDDHNDDMDIDEDSCENIDRKFSILVEETHNMKPFDVDSSDESKETNTRNHSCCQLLFVVLVYVVCAFFIVSIASLAIFVLYFHGGNVVIKYLLPTNTSLNGQQQFNDIGDSTLFQNPTRSPFIMRHNKPHFPSVSFYIF